MSRIVDYKIIAWALRMALEMMDECRCAALNDTCCYCELVAADEALGRLVAKDQHLETLTVNADGWVVEARK